MTLREYALGLCFHFSESKEMKSTGNHRLKCLQGSTGNTKDDLCPVCDGSDASPPVPCCWAVEYGDLVWRGCRPSEFSVILFLATFHLVPKLVPSHDESRVNEELGHSSKLEEKESRQSGLPPSYTGRRCLSRHLPEAHFIKRSAKLVLL